MRLLLTFLSFFVGTFAACPNDGIEWQSVCYYFQGNISAFVNAEEACIHLGGHLASIHNGFTNAFIAQQASLLLHSSTIADIWIGATDLMNPDTWTWTDGSNFTFIDWSQNKSASGEDCGSLNLSEGFWQAQDCFKQKAYVCAINERVNANTSTSTTTTTTTTTTTQKTVTVPSFYDCGWDWIYFPPTHSCYGALTKISWNDAESYCEDHNSHLISIHNSLEYRFVGTLRDIIDDDLWLGLVSYNSGNDWKWTDGTSMNNEYWADDYPKTGSNLCGYMWKDLHWYNDRWCSNSVKVMCKKTVYP
uniref:C-type lectin domain-containing protein n=1 Tax=Panagrolaimus superbus TaxID=310955 RepID=A0A914YGX6_9BILA